MISRPPVVVPGIVWIATLAIHDPVAQRVMDFRRLAGR
jgi:hypothetical protein